MPEILTNNKRIVKNTIFLYIRTIVVLVISLYTSRVVLRTLGVEDYGTYNVVGGFVAMFSLLSGALSNAISRYITFELGKGDYKRLTEVFSTSITVQALIALIIIAIAELIGIWFLNVKMSIPEGRMVAANWVFQCSLLTFGINLISIPYNACIIAHEHMNAFAYVSILDVLMKLGAVLFLSIIRLDRLIAYAFLLVLIALIIRFIYGFYCNRHFAEAHFRFTFNKKLMKEMTSLAGWNMLGSSGQILNSHGINLLMNLFFGVSVNAARGLAVQVNGAVTQFVHSFTTAVNPQITKSYAKEDKEYMFKLVVLSSKYSFFLMLLLAVPIIVETPFVLRVWLSNVPDYTVLFVRLTLIGSLIATMSSSLYTLALATGDIKKYQIVVGSLSLSCFVLTYVCYKLGLPVEFAYYVYIMIQFVILFARLIILSDLTGLNLKGFTKAVIIKAFIVALSIFVLLFIIVHFYPADSLWDSILIMFISIFVSAGVIFLFGINNNERAYLKFMVKHLSR